MDMNIKEIEVTNYTTTSTNCGIVIDKMSVIINDKRCYADIDSYFSLSYDFEYDNGNTYPICDGIRICYFLIEKITDENNDLVSVSDEEYQELNKLLEKTALNFIDDKCEEFIEEYLKIQNNNEE